MAFNWIIPITYTFKSLDDIFYGTGLKQSFNGGAGNDTVSYENSSSGIYANLNEDNRYGMGYGSGGDASGDKYVSIENIKGSNYKDSIAGNDADNILNGLAGNDIFYASKGNDSLIGGAGQDTADYSSNNTAITVRMSRSEIDKGDDNGVDSLDSVERIYGSDYNDFFYGDDSANYFYGNDGQDYFYADAGNDLYAGGNGSDSINYFASTGGVRVDLFWGEGRGGFASGDRYYDIEQVIGSRYDDYLIGSDQGVELSGNDGNDIILGGEGDDFLTGGAGTDTLDGKAGDDTIIGGEGFDTIDGREGQDTLYGADGSDIMRGGNDDDKLIGGEGDDIIDGGAGIDTAVYAVSAPTESPIINEGAIIDLEQGYAIDLWGDRDTLSFIENVTGSAGNDQIIGDSGDNLLEGGNGNDEIDGGEGNDTLYGGNAGYSIVPGPEGSPSDTFIFVNDDGNNGVSHGQDVIMDFEIDSDFIDLSDTEVRNFNDLFTEGDRYMEQVGQDTVIYTMNGTDGDSITLENITMGALSEDNFIF